MAQSEALSNKGYSAFKKEVTKGTIAGIPNLMFPYFGSDFDIDTKFEDDNPIIGNAADIQGVLRGLREHGGKVTFKHEPNVMGYIADMTYEKISTSGADPYTHTFSSLNIGSNNTYTYEEQRGNIAIRALGVENKKIDPKFDKTRGMVETDLVGRYTFLCAEILSATYGAPTTTIVFKTDIDPIPTKAMFVGDTLRCFDVSTSTYIDVLIATIVDTKTITTTADKSALTVGDVAFLKAQTASFSTEKGYTQAGLTDWYFGDDMTAALIASASAVELDSKWSIVNKYDGDKGKHRFGSFDPATVIHTLRSGELSVKKFFADDEEVRRWLAMVNRAVYIKSRSTSSGYEIDYKFYKAQIDQHKKPVDTGNIIYAEMPYKIGYDRTNSKHIEIVVINSVATI